MKRFLLACTLICSSLFAEEALLKQISKGFADVANSAIPAVVFIECQSTQTSSNMQKQGPFRSPFDYFEDEFFNDFFGFPFQSSKRDGQSRGSGFIVSSDGLIMTNNHVVEKSCKVMVTLNDGRKMQAEVVGADPQTDIALIKVDETNLPYLKFGDSNALNVGDWTIAIGNYKIRVRCSIDSVSQRGWPAPI